MKGGQLPIELVAALVEPAQRWAGRQPGELTVDHGLASAGRRRGNLLEQVQEATAIAIGEAF
ncbi:hypothetical protein D3C76_1647060 [compost metagenome]